ncbi:protein kinase [Microcoleus sp. herbarium19]|uniref:protein kinase domain-containing protein n=1 Tax=unclassified Microcoleus TaxID=2642155 RepID=UPI002FD6A1DD
MNSFTDFSTHGYQIEKELGYNSLGGRVTYLATKINTKNSVVIKQFQFAKLDSSWTEYEAYEQEIKVLQSLNHPGIPRYLDSFGTDSGFCMVQEYKNAESAGNRSFAPPDIKQIAIATLEIIAYLQSQTPPVIHRDIKPENLLIDDELNVYLVDFGFARIGGGNIAASSVVKGTMGFMPPEQMFNRQLTEASDLYGLGATLICLLTGTKSVDVGNLIDANYGIHFRHLVPPLQQGWMNWLERMVAPRLQDRYPSAADALTALQSLDVSSLPKVRIERDRIQFTATEYGEILTQTLTASNPIPDTILAGRWEVAPHPNDPPHTPYDHPWISFEPQSFESNELECQIAVNTSKLLANQTYQRQIILHANSEPDSHQITIQVKTAPLPEAKLILDSSIDRLVFMFLFSLVGWLLRTEIISTYGINQVVYSIIGTIPVIGFAAAEKTLNAEVERTEISCFGSIFGAVMGVVVAYVGITSISLIGGFRMFSITTLGNVTYIISFVVSALLGSSVGSIKNNRGFKLVAFLVIGFLITSSGVFLFPEYIWIFPVQVSIIMVVLFFASSAFWLVVYYLVRGRIYGRIKRGFPQRDAVAIELLSAGFYINLGSGFQLLFKYANKIESIEPLEIAVLGVSAILSLLVIAIPLLNLIIFKINKIIAEYHRSEPNLIKP